jgi:hypothetical protein
LALVGVRVPDEYTSARCRHLQGLALFEGERYLGVDLVDEARGQGVVVGGVVHGDLSPRHVLLVVSVKKALEKNKHQR